MIESEMALTVKRKKFIDEYLKCFNATEAARRAGYNATNGSLATIGYELLRNVEIKDKINQHLEESAMSAEEVLNRLAAIARGNIKDVIHISSVADVQALDDKAAIIKKIKRKVTTTNDGEIIEDIEFELYSAHDALRDIGKYHAIFTDKTEHKVKIDTPIQVVEIIKPE